MVMYNNGSAVAVQLGQATSSPPAPGPMVQRRADPRRLDSARAMACPALRLRRRPLGSTRCRAPGSADAGRQRDGQLRVAEM